jgi:hypothetical protein
MGWLADVSLTQVKSAVGSASVDIVFQPPRRGEAGRAKASSAAAVRITPQGLHSKVWRSGMPPPRGTERTSFIVRPQFGQVGVLGAGRLMAPCMVSPYRRDTATPLRCIKIDVFARCWRPAKPPRAA